MRLHYCVSFCFLMICQFITFPSYYEIQRFSRVLFEKLSFSAVSRYQIAGIQAECSFRLESVLLYYELISLDNLSHLYRYLNSNLVSFIRFILHLMPQMSNKIKTVQDLGKIDHYVQLSFLSSHFNRSNTEFLAKKWA